MTTSNWQYFLHLYYKTCQRCCFLPIFWDNTSHSVKFEKSRIRIFLWAMMQTYLTADTVYLTVTICTENYRGLTPVTTMKLLSHGISRIAACIVIGWFVNNFKSANHLINQVCKVHEKLKGIRFHSFNSLHINRNIVRIFTSPL